MTLEAIRKHQFYLQLSKQQGVFVIARCEGDDELTAARKAWNCSTDASARTMANRATRNPNISWLVSQFYGVGPIPTREEMASDAWRRARTAEDADFVRLSQIIINLLGYETKPANEPDAPPAKTEDGDEPFQL